MIVVNPSSAYTFPLSPNPVIFPDLLGDAPASANDLCPPKTDPASVARPPKNPRRFNPNLDIWHDPESEIFALNLTAMLWFACSRFESPSPTQAQMIAPVSATGHKLNKRSSDVDLAGKSFHISDELIER
jgi:hypothetical protein